MIWKFLLAAFLLLPVAAYAQSNQIGQQYPAVRSFGAAGADYAVSQAPPAGTLTLYSVNISLTTASGYLMVFDAGTVPGSGNTVAFPVLRFCAPVTQAQQTWLYAPPDVFSNNVIVAYSSTGCTTYTAATALWLGGQAQ